LYLNPQCEINPVWMQQQLQDDMAKKKEKTEE
jgi:hypothetical protein